MECAYCGKELVLPWRDPESVAWVGPAATLAFCDQDHYEKYAER